jgi:imidazolonepropionase-like amidohydrolase
VLVRNGRISAVGTDLAAGNATVIDAQAARLTPALFGGITDIGLEEVSGEADHRRQRAGAGRGTHEMAVRPEFDVTLAYNPRRC